MPEQHEEAIISLVKAQFREKFGSSSASFIMDRVTLDRYSDGVVTLKVDSEFTYNILKERYLGELGQAFSSILGFPVTVDLLNTSHPTDAEEITRNFAGNVYGTQEEKPQETSGLARAVQMPAFTFEYTFDNFITGSSNRFAHAACLAVVKDPGTGYNPLFIYGPSGIGKTHLLYATINGLKKVNPDIRIAYVKGDDFTNEMVESLSKQEMKQFRDKYRKCDVLLIDDVQFIAGKVATQEEFFHTFNALYEERKQIIMTSDKPPQEIQKLEDRLVTRFEWGLLADIQAPDLELRMAIIKKKAEQVGLDIGDDIIEYLAENLRSNVRQLEGAIKKLGAFKFVGQSITMDTARGCIAELLGGAEPQNVTLSKIFAAVKLHYGIDKPDLVGKKRSKEIAFARHICIYLIRDITEMSYPNIGKMFERDHTTVLSSIEVIDRKLRTDRVFESAYADIKKEITG